jgi:sodium-dependent dicarboxylate transporter 2/3/5
MSPDTVSDRGVVSARRAGLAFLIALALALGLYAWLPFDATVRKGLCLLVFIGLLWLTEAIPLAVTALLVPVGALVLGFPGLTTSFSCFWAASPWPVPCVHNNWIAKWPDSC